MRRWHCLALIFWLAGGVFSWRAMAEASGTIAAQPNPCVIAAGAPECTSYITWSTEGAKHARVFVTAPHTTGTRETEFGDALSCEGERCRAPWIKKGDRYVFTLYDYSSGARGRVLASVTVTGTEGSGRVESSARTESSGTIAAHPNPCVIAAGKAECTSDITWSTQGATHARVFVMSQHTAGEREAEFAEGLTCKTEKCSAPWIKKGEKFVFTLYDYSSGARGRALASVTVTATGGK